MTFYEFLLQLARIVWGDAWKRIATLLVGFGVFSLVGITQYVIPPLAKTINVKISIPETPTWVGFGLVFAGIGTLVLRNLFERIKPPATAHPHDIELVRRFLDVMDLRAREFLREHNYRNPFLMKRLDPIEALVNDWHGAAFEFEDLELGQAFENVQLAARSLLDKTGERIFGDVVKEGLILGSPLTNLDRRHGISDETRRGIGEMNELAVGVLGAVDKFERLARAKIPTPEFWQQIAGRRRPVND